MSSEPASSAPARPDADRGGETGHVDGEDATRSASRPSSSPAEELLEDEAGRAEPEGQRRLPREQAGGEAHDCADDAGERRIRQADDLEARPQIGPTAVEDGQRIADEACRDRGRQHETTGDQAVDPEPVGAEATRAPRSTARGWRAPGPAVRRPRPSPPVRGARSRGAVSTYRPLPRRKRTGAMLRAGHHRVAVSRSEGQHRGCRS